MGVYLDKYFGYMLDVTEEYLSVFHEKSKNEEDEDYIFNKYISCSIEDLDNELKELNFNPYYSRQKQKENDITLIYDGMSGDYCKLIFIKQIDKYCYYESDVDMENEYLKSIPIPDDIRDKMTKVYENIFGKSEKELEIHLMKLNHYH